MNILIFGAGRRGLRIAKRLIEEKKSVTFLDTSPEHCQTAQSKLDCMAFCGSATNLSDLVEAGIAEMDTVIAVTDSDEVNLVSCGIVASNFKNVTKTIAAIRSISYIGNAGLSESEHQILGISHIVNPYEEAALRIVDIIRRGLYQETITFPDTNFLLFTTQIGHDSDYIGRTLIDIRQNSDYNFVVVGLMRKGKVITPSGKSIIHQGDTLAMISDDLEFRSILGIDKVPDKYKAPESIYIIGATKITRYLLGCFTSQERKNVRLVERDSEVATEFSNLFPEILVLNASITDEQLWDEEGIDKADLLISLTENDEQNIITSSYAKRCGVKKTIAMIRTNANYAQFALSLDVDVALSITDVTADSVMKYLKGDGVSAMHTLFNGGLEVYEYVVQESFKYVGMALKELNLRNRVIIASVKKENGISIVPDGNYVFCVGDSIILAASRENSNHIQEFLS